MISDAQFARAVQQFGQPTGWTGVVHDAIRRHRWRCDLGWQPQDYRAVWRVGKWRDCPEIFRPDPNIRLDGNTMPKVIFQNGTFLKIIWCNIHPGHWPEPVLIPLTTSDALVITQDWGLEARILGGIFL